MANPPHLGAVVHDPPPHFAPRFSRAIALAALSTCALVSACSVPPRVDVKPEDAIVAAAGLPSPIALRIIGPDGGPLDEPSSPDADLTLADAVRRAVESDPGLQAALARVRVAMAEADQARLLPNPILNFVFRAGSGSPQIEASLTQAIVQALQIPARASASDNRLRAAAADAVGVALDVVSDVQDHYISSQASAALLPILEERRAILGRLLSTARARLDAGEGTRSDVVTLDAQRVALQVSIDSARLEERTNRLRLARLLGEPTSAASWRLATFTPPALSSQPESAWIEAALAARPEIQSIAWRLKSLGDEEALTALLPWEGANVGIDAQKDGGWQLGPSISVPIPIFDQGQAKRAAILALQLQARHELTLARRRVVEDVRTAHNALRSSNAILARIRSELLPLERQRRQLAEDAYRAGQTDVTPLFLAEQDLLVTEMQAIEVEAQTATALIRLQRAAGGPGVAEKITRAESPSRDGEVLRVADDRSSARNPQKR